VQVKSAKSIRSDGGGHSTKSVGFQDGQQTPMTSLTSDATFKMKIGRTNPAIPVAVCCLLLLSAATPPSSAQASAQQPPQRPLGVPYLDQDSGQICEERTATVEEMEYDEQIHCKVQMKRKCKADRLDDLLDNLAEAAAAEGEEEDEMGEACHTMYKKECRISYRPRMTKVRVRVCPKSGRVNVVKSLRPGRTSGNNSVVLDVMANVARNEATGGIGVNNGGEGECDPATGKRKICVKKYETECRTRYVKQMMMEDQPRCRVQLVEQCPQEEEQQYEQKSEDEDADYGGGNDLDVEGIVKSAECIKVPAMRCKIEKVEVMKSKPETKCTRVPREFCRKEACEPASRDECYFRNKVVNEIVPEEKCDFRPQRVCHTVRRRKKRNRRFRAQGRARRSPTAEESLGLRRSPRRWDWDWAGDQQRQQKQTQRSRRAHAQQPPKRRAAGNSKCVNEPVQRCEKVRVNPRPVTRAMRKRVCRTPDDTDGDRALVRKLLSPPPLVAVRNRANRNLQRRPPRPPPPPPPPRRTSAFLP